MLGFFAQQSKKVYAKVRRLSQAVDTPSAPPAMHQPETGSIHMLVLSFPTRYMDGS
jgi:hypothetical protein